jgi:sulfotransferase
MKNLHMVTGLPRAGSTLLCNILNQNPAAFASDTSGVFGVMMEMSHAIGRSEEFKSDLINDKDTTMERILTMQRGVVQNSYQHETGIVFDKARGWAAQAKLVAKLFPTSKLIVLVRDVKAVLASIEKNHLDTIELMPDAGLSPRLIDRIQLQTSDAGIVGSAVNAVMDTTHRMAENTIILKYEEFVANPEKKMAWLYGRLGMDPFEHDFDNVECTATDQDGLYWYKFPHQGFGKVEAREEIDQYLQPRLQKLIDEEFKIFNETFGYNTESERSVVSIAGERNG